MGVGEQVFSSLTFKHMVITVVRISSRTTFLLLPLTRTFVLFPLHISPGYVGLSKKINFVYSNDNLFTSIYAIPTCIAAIFITIIVR